MFRKVLVPLDGSEFGERALPWAAHLARRDGAALHLVCVHVPLADLFAERRPNMENLADRPLLQRDRDYLAVAMKRFADATPAGVTSAVLEGPVAEAIEEYARAAGIDLVVLMTHGRGPFSRFWLGSVADDLVRRLPMPILLLRPGDKRSEAAPIEGFRHLLIPLDGSPLAEQVLEPALELGGGASARYTLLRVMTPIPQASHDAGPFGFPPVVLPTIDKLHAEGKEYLEGVARRLQTRGLRVETAVAIHGQPAVSILDVALNCGCDLVALETHGRKGLARFLLGSVADKIVRGATLPVLVHRTPVP
jgi:nucleotide-binding universal stress UspA family protein